MSEMSPIDFSPKCIQCPDPKCLAVSYNRNDIELRYCGRCNRFHADYLYSAAEAPLTGPITPEELEAAGQEVLFARLPEPLQTNLFPPAMVVVSDYRLPDISQFLVAPGSSLIMRDSVNISGTLSFVIPDGIKLEEDVYLLGMARRYQQRLGDISMVQAMQMAVASLESYYLLENCKFGDEGHRWDLSCAEEIVDEDLEHWDAD